ncbi:hypothetical protein MMC24_004128 [Lignoscripta atroalba]|nr:hypothetical protein [Lignoscripta atroalba]
MPTIVISGAGSGIGHTFLKTLSSDPSNTIYALDITFSEEVRGDNITRHTVDTSSPESVADFSSALGSQPIDMFIHSAAVRGLVPSVTEKEDDPGAAETMDVMDVPTFTKTLQINTLGSFLLIRALIPNLKAAASSSTRTIPKVVIMGSRMGSVGANNTGSAYAYRASKAGLNAIAKSFSVDVPEVCFTVLHPGRVESRMVPNVREEGAVDAEDAVEEMMPIIKGLEKKDTGKFYFRDGGVIEW